jgi:putative ABC transport system permease protein
MTIVRLVYRVLLVLLAAPKVRRRFGPEMLSTFDALADAARPDGWRAVVLLLGRETADLIVARRSRDARHLSALRHPTAHSPRVGDPATKHPNAHSPRVGDPAATKGSPMFTLRRQLRGILQLRVAVRALRRRPAFVMATLATFVLGTAVTTTVFTVVDTVLIKPLPYDDPDRLVTIYEASEANPGQTSLIAPARLADWNRLNRAFSLISGSYAESVTDTSATYPERLAGRRVAPSYFQVFGVDAILGRTFSSDEERSGGARAAVLSDGFWTRRYARDPRVLGRSLIIGNSNHVIVGVMPANFEIGPTDVWLPAQFSAGMLQARNARFLNGIGRLRPDISIAQANDDLARVQRELGAQFPKTDQGWTAALGDLKGFRVGSQHRARLWLAFAAVALLWLIALSNVSGLVLVETHRRSREMAMRTALGASRARIVSLVFPETLLLAIAGAALGTAVSYWALQYVKLTFVMIPRISELVLDWRALSFAAATNAVAALVSGLIPALNATRGARIQEVSHGVRGTTVASHTLQRSLVVAQVALSVLLCGSALLLARSYANLTRADVGFSADRVVAFHVAARWDEDRKRVGQLQQDIVEALERLPGVEAVGVANFLPAGGAPWRREALVEGLRLSESRDTLDVGQRTVSAGYLKAIQVPLLAGDWCPAFRSEAPPSVMVNAAFAQRFADPAALVGQRLRVTEFAQTYTIVGIVGNVAEDGPAIAASPYTYQCARPGDWPDPEYVVRAKNAEAIVGELRMMIRGIDTGRAVFSIRPMSEILASATAQPRLSMGLVGGFAAAAMLLVATGLYALFTLVVGETRREMGVRLALGASPRQLVRLVCAGAGRLLVVGMLVGVVLMVGAGRWLQNLLFGISAVDAVAFAGALLTLIVVSTLAIGIPALRAARVLPSEALRID